MQKKILILGGANLHCKLVKAAREMGLYTIVTDYLVDSPAKLMADKSYMYDVNDIDGIVDMCKAEGVDGVISTHLDPCQRPYYLICQRLGLPCYIDTWEQVYTLTDKDAFKVCCAKYGVDTIPAYDVEDVKSGVATMDFPVLVKPAHSRGSRGQSVCDKYEEVLAAIDIAEKESGNGHALIEKYMGNTDDFTMTYIFDNGTSYMTKTSDRHLGDIELGLEKVGIGTLSPSIHTEMYIHNVQDRLLNMLHGLGIKNGPVFMQGFADGDTVRFYDPGYRFPGSEYDTMFENIWGIDIMKMMVEFAMTGSFSGKYGRLNNELYQLKGHAVITLFPAMKAGTIKEIKGLQEIAAMPEVVCYTLRHEIGETVSFTGTVNQRFGEFDIVGEDLQDLLRAIDRVLKTLHVLGEDGEELLFGNINVEKVNQRYADMGLLQTGGGIRLILYSAFLRYLLTRKLSATA